MKLHCHGFSLPIPPRKEARIMSDTFSRYHPVVNFLFFALVLVFSMVLMHRCAC